MSVLATGPSNGLYLKSVSNVYGFGAVIAADGSFVSSAGATIRNISLDPTGVLTAAAGSLALRNNGTLYLNTNGGTNWLSIGSVAVPGNSVVPDPGNGNPIANNVSGNLALTYGAGVETRTLADPVVVGQVLNISVASAGAGACNITAANNINNLAQKTMNFANVAAFIQLTSINRGGALRWQFVASQLVALS